MKKERTRFDALAEELDEPAPIAKPSKASRKTLTKEARARLDAIVDGYKPDEELPEDFDAEDGSAYKFPPPQQPAAKKLLGRVPKRDDSQKPNAYISAKGQMYPVVSWNITTSIAREEEYVFRTARRGDYEVKFKLTGTVRKEILDDDVMLVIAMNNGDDPHFFRLNVTNVRWSVSGSFDNWTEIEANAVQVA